MISPESLRGLKKSYIVINGLRGKIYLRFFYYNNTFINFWNGTINVLFEVKFFIKY